MQYILSLHLPELSIQLSSFSCDICLGLLVPCNRLWLRESFVLQVGELACVCNIPIPQSVGGVDWAGASMPPEGWQSSTSPKHSFSPLCWCGFGRAFYPSEELLSSNIPQSSLRELDFREAALPISVSRIS